MQYIRMLKPTAYDKSATSLRSLQTSASFLALVALAISLPHADASATDECGPLVDGEVTCDQVEYPNGISYPNGGTINTDNPLMIVYAGIDAGASNNPPDSKIYPTVVNADRFTYIASIDAGGSNLDSSITATGGIIKMAYAFASGVGNASVTLKDVENYNSTHIAKTTGGGLATMSMTGGSAQELTAEATNGSSHLSVTGGSLVSVIAILATAKREPFQTQFYDLETTVTLDSGESGLTISGYVHLQADIATAKFGDVTINDQADYIYSTTSSLIEIQSQASQTTTLNGTQISAAHDNISGIALINKKYYDSEHIEPMTITTTNAGISVTGNNSIAMNFINDRPVVDSEVTVNGGAISVSGDQSTAIQLTSSSARNTLTLNGGKVYADGVDSNALLLSVGSKGSSSLQLNEGEISSAGGDAIVFIDNTKELGVSIAIDIASSATVSAPESKNAFISKSNDPATIVTVTTSGTARGNFMLGTGRSDFTLAGGTVTGEVYGDYDAQSGQPSDIGYQLEDRFHWSGGIFAGDFYGQGGDDKVNFVNIGNANAGKPVVTFDGGPGFDVFSQTGGQLIFSTIPLSLGNAIVTVNFEVGDFGTDAEAVFASNSFVLNGFRHGSDKADFDDRYGDLIIHDGGTVTISPDGGGPFDLAANVHIADAQSSLVVSGAPHLKLSGHLRNAGLLSLANGSAGDTITIGTSNGASAYSSARGRIALDVDLSTGLADSITINGKLKGKTMLLVNNVGGKASGALLTIVRADTAIEDGAFMLDARHPVVAGIQAFGLEQRSSITGGSVNLVPVGYQPYVPLYEAYQSVVLEMMHLPSLKTRSGGRYDNGEALTAGQALDAMWGRIGGGYDHFDPQSSTASYDYDMSSFEMQAGLDGLFLDNAEGALIGGFTAHYKTGEAKIASPYGDSKIHPDGYGFGGTLTWFGANGFYADAQAELTWYTSELKADDLPLSPKDSDGFGYAVSMELGQAFGLGDGMALTPQAQLAFADVSIDSFTGAYSDDVSFSDGQSLLARAGLALEKETAWQDINGQARAANVYGSANLYYEFLGETKARVVNLYDFTTDPDDFSGEIGFGGSIDWQAGKLQYSAFAELTAATGFNTGSYGYGGNVGLKLRW